MEIQSQNGNNSLPLVSHNNMSLADKQSITLNTIQQVGELTPLAVAKQRYQYPRLKDLPPKQVSSLFGVVFTRIVSLVGIKGDIDPLQKEEIWNVVFSRFSWLSFQDIYKAFQMDRSRVFGVKTDHYQFFDVSYVSEVLDRYQQWLQSTQQEHHIKWQQCQAKQITMSKEDEEKIIKEWLSNHFKEYQQTQQMPIISVPVYDALHKQGVLKPYFSAITEEDKEAMRIETKKRLQIEQTQAKDRQGHTAIKTILEHFIKGESDPTGKLLRLKKEITLQFFYDWLIAQGKELSEMLSPQHTPNTRRTLTEH